MKTYPKIKCPNCELKGNVVKTDPNWYSCLNCHIGFYMDDAEADPTIKFAREYDRFLASGGELGEILSG